MYAARTRLRPCLVASLLTAVCATFVVTNASQAQSTVISSPPPPRRGYWSIQEITDVGFPSINSMVEADFVLGGDVPGVLWEGMSSVINFADPEGLGRGYSINAIEKRPFFSDTPANDQNFVMRAIAKVIIPEDGQYTFGFDGDDGSRLTLSGAAFTLQASPNGGAASGEVIEFAAATHDSFTIASSFLTAGEHDIEVVWYERAGDAFFEVFAAPGVKNAFDSDFSLIGQQQAVQRHLGALPTASDWTVRSVDVFRSRPLNSLADAQEAIELDDLDPFVEFAVDGRADVINYVDPDTNDSAGRFGEDTPFLINRPNADDDDFATMATTTVTIAEDGDYLFGFGSDEGASLTLEGADFTIVGGTSWPQAVTNSGQTLKYDQNMSYAMIVGTTFLPAGDYELSFLTWERDGGAWAEVMTGVGTSTYDLSLTARLLGAPAESFDFSMMPGLQLGGEPVTDGIHGDYNANGTVEQADLDLVLLNWGSELTDPASSGWINDLPNGAIDQEELDKVLRGWGASSAATGSASVPEPAAVAIALLCGLFVVVALARTLCPRSAMSASLVAIIAAFISANASHAQFTTVIDSPPRIPDGRTIGSNTQLNVSEGGGLGSRFQAGQPSADNTNIEVNIAGGFVQGPFDAWSGSRVNLSSGNVGGVFTAHDGSRVNISGGSVIDLQLLEGSSLRLSGGALGEVSLHEGSRATIVGGEFRLDGQPIEGLAASGDELTIEVPEGAFFDGILSDGTPFYLTRPLSDIFVTAQVLPLPPVGPSLITASIDTTPPGIRAGQTLHVDALIANAQRNFNAGRGSFVSIPEGGQLQGNFQLVGADVVISGGWVTNELVAASGSQVAMTSGDLGEIRADASRVTMAGGVVHRGFAAMRESQVAISSGLVLSGVTASGGTEVKISGGFIDGLLATSSHVAISGGTVIGSLGAGGGSDVAITGGKVPSLRTTYSDLVISGGLLQGDLVATGGNVHILGTEILLDGVSLSGAQLGVALTVEDRNVELSGSLADGSPFSIDLNGTYSRDEDFFPAATTLRVTLVSLVPGDYDSNGTVDQADLDLVLLNWGKDIFNPFAAGWINDIPSGVIDQQELDKVLLDWGNSVDGLATVGVPEPGTAAMGLVTVVILALRRRRGGKWGRASSMPLVRSCR